MVQSVIGCASHRATPQRQLPDSSPTVTKAATTQPILYHRTGGIAGTDDRVVIWPDGYVEVTGKILPDTAARLPADRLRRLASMFDGRTRLKNAYLTSNIPDAYTITIHYGS